MPDDGELTHVNLNDGTVEGLELPGVAFSVQYHPESGPGPHDSRYLFAKFKQFMDEFEPEFNRPRESVDDRRGGVTWVAVTARR